MNGKAKRASKFKMDPSQIRSWVPKPPKFVCVDVGVLVHEKNDTYEMGSRRWKLWRYACARRI